MRLRCWRLQIVYDMEQAGVEPTAYTYTTLLDCLAQRGKAFDGFQVNKKLRPAPRSVCVLAVNPACRGITFEPGIFRALRATRPSGYPASLQSKAFMPLGFALCTAMGLLLTLRQRKIRPILREDQSHSPCNT